MTGEDVAFIEILIIHNILTTSILISKCWLVTQTKYGSKSLTTMHIKNHIFYTAPGVRQEAYNEKIAPGVI